MKGYNTTREGKEAAVADERPDAIPWSADHGGSRLERSSAGRTWAIVTHKRVDAWDTLGQALLEAGFAIHSSWPVHAEPETSLHQAKKNAAASTVLLTCLST